MGLLDWLNGTNQPAPPLPVAGPRPGAQVYGPPLPPNYTRPTPKPPVPTPQPAPAPKQNPRSYKLEPERKQYAPYDNGKTSTGPQNRRVGGSHQKQKLIDSFPSFAELRQSLEDEGEWPDDAETQQQLASLYHAKVTQRSTRYKSASPELRAQMDAGISRAVNGGDLQVPAPSADLLDERWTSSGPVSNVAMNVVNNSPMGQGYTAITGQAPYRTREAQGGIEQGAETIGNIGTILATFAGAAGLAGMGTAAAGASPWLASVIPGMAGTLATSVPQNAAGYRTGAVEGDQALLNVGVDALAGGLLGPLGQLIPGAGVAQSVLRNAAQTGTQTAADLSKGVAPNLQDLAINIGSGAMLDVMGGRNKAKPPSIEDEIRHDVQSLPSGGAVEYGTSRANDRAGFINQNESDTERMATRALPPGSTNVSPMGEAHLNGVPADAEMERQANRIRSGLMLPEPQRLLNAPRERGNPAGAAFDDTRPNAPDVVYAEGSPPFARQIPQGNTVFAGPAPRPAPKPDLTIPERITALEAQASRYREALSRKGGKPERRGKIADALRQTERQIFDLQQEHLRDNPVPYSPEGAGVRREIDRQVAEQKTLRDAGYDRISEANEAGIETDGGLINDATKMQRIRMMGNDQLREQLNKLAPTDTKETFAEGTAAVTSARDEIGRLRDPLTAERTAAELTDMDRAMVAQRKAEDAARVRSGATPDDATVRGESADEFFRRKAAEAIPEQSPLQRVPLGLAGADEQMAAIRAAGDAQRAADEDIPAFDDPRFDKPEPAPTMLRAGMGPFASTADALKAAEQTAKVVGGASRLVDKAAIRLINAAGRRLGSTTDLVDSTGTLVAGRDMIDRAATFLREKKQSKAADWLSSQVVDDYALPENYRQMRDQYRQTQDTIARQFMKAHEEQLAGLSDAEQVIVYDVLTNENAAPGAYQSLRQDLRDLLDTMGQRAVDAGVISQESFNRNKGTHLSRSYAEHELGNKASNTIGRLGRAIKFATSQMKGRGVSRSVADSTLARLPQTGTNSKTGKPLYEVNGETWELRAPGVLWRDWNKAERVQMGELEDASYAFLKTGHQISRNIATGEFYRDLAKDSSISRKPADEAEAAQLAKDGWQLVGGNAAGTNRPKWGALDGHYVHPDIHRDLVEIQRMQTSGVWKELLTQWKLNKTARNPVVHMNNVMSNFSLLELNGGNADDVFTAGRIMAGKGDDAQTAMYEQAQELGVFGSVHDELGTQMRSMLKGIGAVRAGMTMPEKVWHFIKSVDQKMLNTYGAEDGLFRFALYMNDVKNGMSPEAAAKRAKTAFVDYNITAPAINAARNSVLPFVGYAYRALPLLARGIAERPWKAAKIALAWQGANALFSAIAGGNEKEERAAMSGQVRNAPFHMRMPVTDSRGQARYLDTTKYIPGADILGGINEAARTGDVGEAIKGVGNTFSMGGPMLDAYNLRKNQKPDAPPGLDHIWDTNTPGSRQWKDAARYAYEPVMPNNPLVPGTYSFNKIASAVQGKPDAYGRQDTVPGAALATVGIKTRPVDTKELQDKRRAKADREENAARKVISMARGKYRRGGLSKAEFEEIRDEQAGVIKEIRRQFKGYRENVKAAR